MSILVSKDFRFSINFGVAAKFELTPPEVGNGYSDNNAIAFGSIRFAGMRFPGNGSRTKLPPAALVVAGSKIVPPWNVRPRASVLVLPTAPRRSEKSAKA